MNSPRQNNGKVRIVSHKNGAASVRHVPEQPGRRVAYRVPAQTGAKSAVSYARDWAEFNLYSVVNS
jgi:hypothetical protein